MKKIFLFVLCCVAAMSVSTSCRFAREDNPGDTVAANEFDPTIGQKAKSLHTSADTSAMNSTVDSTIFSLWVTAVRSSSCNWFPTQASAIPPFSPRHATSKCREMQTLGTWFALVSIVCRPVTPL